MRPAVARSPGLGLVAAGRATGVSTESLRRLVDEGAVRFLERRPHGRGEAIMFDSEQLVEDLAGLPRCRSTSGCRQPGTGRSGYCGKHFGEAGRAGAGAARREQTRSWVTFEEARERLGSVAPDTLRKRLMAGAIAAERVGKGWRIDAESLEAFCKDWAPPSHQKRLTTSDDRRIAELHGLGRTVGAIAAEIGCSKPAVYEAFVRRGLRRPGAGRRSRRLDANGRDRRRDEAARLYVDEGLSLSQVAAQLDSSPTQIRRDLEQRGVEIRPTGAAAKYPAPEERECKACGDPFTPTYGSFDVKRRRFCSDDCARAARAARLAFEVHAAGLLTTAEVADKLGVGMGRIGSLREQGLLAGEKLSIDGSLRPVYGYAESEVESFIRAWARGGDGRRWAAMDPKVRARIAKKNGQLEAEAAIVGADEAEALLELAVERRRKQYQAHRRGRKPGQKPRVARWTAAINPDAGVPPLGECRALALADWQAHAEDWPRVSWPADRLDPNALATGEHQRAADRIQKALRKALHTCTN